MCFTLLIQNLAGLKHRAFQGGVQMCFHVQKPLLCKMKSFLGFGDIRQLFHDYGFQRFFLEFFTPQGGKELLDFF